MCEILLDTKPCKRCKEIKSIFEFRQRKKKEKAFFENICKACRSKDDLTRYNIFKEEKLNNPNEIKQCNQCKLVLPLKDFRIGRNTCLSCGRPSKRKRRQELKEINIEKLRAVDMFYNAKIRARKLNLPFNIEISDIVIPEYCPILGIKLKLDNSKMQYNSPSLDRIIPELGYIKGNIKVISWEANKFKSDYHLRNFKTMANYIETSLSPELLHYLDNY